MEKQATSAIQDKLRNSRRALISEESAAYSVAPSCTHDNFIKKQYVSGMKMAVSSYKASGMALKSLPRSYK